MSFLPSLEIKKRKAWLVFAKVLFVLIPFRKCHLIKFGIRSLNLYFFLWILFSAAQNVAYAQITFGMPTRYDLQMFSFTNENQPLASADFNGDSRSDLVIAVDGGFAVFTNRGDGTLLPHVIYPSSTSRAVIALDLNRDGFADLAFPTGVALNRGDGTFLPFVTYPTSSFPLSIAAGDFNQDGAVDLVILSTQGLHILQNNGSGAFTVLNPVITLDARKVVTADVNQDGFPDLIGGTGFFDNPSTISVLINRRNGTFATPVSYTIDRGIGTFISADFNNDGYPDLALTTSNSFNNSIGVMLNRGDGSFPAPTYYLSSFFILTVYPADLDGDGNVDLLAFGTGEGSSGHFSVLRNNGTGTFTPLPSFALGERANGYAIVVDLDGDGRRDIVALSTSPPNLYILRNTTPQTPSPLRIDRVSPNHGGNAGVVTVRILGNGFKSGAQVKLTGLGNDINGTTSIESSSGTLITTTFDLKQGAVGIRDVVVVNPDLTSANLVRGFTVEHGGAPQIWVDILGINRIARGRQQTYYIHYGNRGNLDNTKPFTIWASFSKFLILSMTNPLQPSSSGQTEQDTIISFEIFNTIPPGTTGTIVLVVKAPVDPLLVQPIFNVTTWVNSP